MTRSRARLAGPGGLEPRSATEVWGRCRAPEAWRLSPTRLPGVDDGDRAPFLSFTRTGRTATETPPVHDAAWVLAHRADLGRAGRRRDHAGAGLEAINTIAAFVIGSALVEAGVTPGIEPVEDEAVSNAYSSIAPAQFPTLAAAMGESLALLNDDEAQFETALDALVRGVEASFRERGC